MDLASRLCYALGEEDLLMTITLPPEVHAQIQHRIESGRYPDAEAVIVKALEALEAQEQAQFQKTRELVLAGFNSGPGGELTDEVWAEIEREADEAYQQGEKPSPHVCP